jgi:hypothetical protein
MPASRRTKIIVWTIVCGFVVAVGWFAYGYCRAFYRFASEERICGAFHPVTDAITQFQQSTGTLPTNLTQLVPGYLPQIPTAPVADSIDYRVMADGTNWQLKIHSRIAGSPRMLIQRSSQEFTAEERRRSVTAFHGWVGFAE